MVGFRKIAVLDDQAAPPPIAVAVVGGHLDDVLAFGVARLAGEG